MVREHPSADGVDPISVAVQQDLECAPVTGRGSTREIVVGLLVAAHHGIRRYWRDSSSA